MMADQITKYVGVLSTKGNKRWEPRERAASEAGCTDVVCGICLNARRMDTILIHHYRTCMLEFHRNLICKYFQTGKDDIHPRLGTVISRDPEAYR